MLQAYTAVNTSKHISIFKHFPLSALTMTFHDSV